ncbi:NDR1/HIN1-like protein 6 [Sesamum angolense]|uniref:NDR1/HIN1-like protein 6 n=2 Tax=Sesamum TaxID=4181 RepID=A0AAE2C516_9LAMI|nr:NDR1/HIN1-like protein 6 [Sesamum angolense]
MTASPAQHVVLPPGSRNPGSTGPPIYHHNVPAYSTNYPKKPGGKSCFRCICCCCCCLLLLIFVLAILTFFFYNMYKPKVPSYDIQDLQVKSFDLQPGSILNTELLVNVKADNPNSHIGFTYGDDSSIDVVYSDANLCTGKLPYFYQGHQNTTLMTIDLVGKSVLASGVQEDFAQRQKEGKIPLLVKVKVPLRIVIGNMPLRQFKVFLNCSLVVDSLTPNKKVGVLSSNTTLYFEF